MKNTSLTKEENKLPLLVQRELVLFPHTVATISINRNEDALAVQQARTGNTLLFVLSLVPQAPGKSQKVGTVAHIEQEIRMPDGSLRVILSGKFRAKQVDFMEEGGVPMTTFLPYFRQTERIEEGTEGNTDFALARALQVSFGEYCELSKKVPPEALSRVQRVETYEELANIVAHALPIKPAQKIDFLLEKDNGKRLLKLLETLELEKEVVSLQRKISGKVKKRMEKNQRAYILNEQIKEIQKELGEGDEEELLALEKAIEAKNPGPEVLTRARKELARLKKLQVMSPEAGVLRTWLETLAELPWSATTEDRKDIAGAAIILDEDHYDMKKAKERILEFIAVRFLTPEAKGPILCLVGPPGTGKTSLARSVARALGRSFVRVSLGGVRDEAEIRGHRKTYVGALPGKIIQSLKKAKTSNPVFLLDEIDKLSNDYRGDPASALLEVLDPEQNATFTDHYLELHYDLSKVLFIATANSLHTIPRPLLDRMEIIEIPGYGEKEKLAIAKRYLVAKALRENGLAQSAITFKDGALLEIIRHWTMESGVRSLEREIARCIRRLGREAVEQGWGPEGKGLESFRKIITAGELPKLLGRKKYRKDVAFTEPRVGVVNGLAWTEAGGSILPIEAVRFDGKGGLLLTGNLGDVMKESAQTALSYIRSAQGRLGYTERDFSASDFHIHVPEGAIPKDGPSAGVALSASLLSVLIQKPPKARVAMTGELTLSGRVLPIGGLKEKLLAAIRNGMEEAIIPAANADELAELSGDLKGKLTVHLMETADEAFAILFS